MTICVYLCALTLYLCLMLSEVACGKKQDFNDRATGNSTPPTLQTQRQLCEESSSLSTIMSLMSQSNDIIYAQNPQLAYHHPPDMVERPYNMNNIAPIYNNGQYTIAPPQYSQSDAQLCTQQTITTNTTSAPGMNETRSDESERNSNGSNEPPWVANMLQGLYSRLQQIEGHLGFQNTRWQAIDTKLQNQNVRMTNMEQQMTELNSMKQNMSRMQTTVDNLNAEVIHCSKKVNEYDSTIQTYSEMYDEVKSKQTTTDSLAYDLQLQVEELQKGQDDLINRVTGAEGSITDLQCRSMRDNLLFTGIDEPTLVEGETEDTEKTLYSFLATEMNIHEKIAFHRVHRMGTRERENGGPRPIVAKFERFKDREYVRFQAPKTLRGKLYGVREQFPKVVEDQRKRLYPEAKRARADSKQNKVRLVRDRLFINGSEYVPPPIKDRQQYEGQGERTQRAGRSYNVRDQWHHQGTKTYTSRVFQRSTKPTHNASRFQNSPKPTHNAPAKFIDFSSYNKYGVLAEESPMDRSESRKNKANSPPDSQTAVKKICDNRSDSENENSSPSLQAANVSQDFIIDLSSQQDQVEPPSRDNGLQSHGETVDTPIQMDTQVSANGDVSSEGSHDVPRDNHSGQ